MATNMELKRTPKGKGYWQANGAYQKEYDELWKQLVPMEGEAQTTNGEILRTSARLYYDYFNNGNMNACKIVGRYIDADDADEELSYEVDEYYKGCLNFLRRACKDDYELQGLLNHIEEIILMGEVCAYQTDDEQTYNLMADHCIYWVLTHEDKPVNPFTKIKR